MRLVRHLVTASLASGWVTGVLANQTAMLLFVLCETSVVVYDMQQWRAMLTIKGDFITRL